MVEYFGAYVAMFGLLIVGVAGLAAAITGDEVFMRVAVAGVIVGVMGGIIFIFTSVILK